MCLVSLIGRNDAGNRDRGCLVDLKYRERKWVEKKRRNGEQAEEYAENFPVSGVIEVRLLDSIVEIILMAHTHVPGCNRLGEDSRP